MGEGDYGRFDVDIHVAYADENRNHMLLAEWRRQAGESVPPPPLRLPRVSQGSYAVRIRRTMLHDLVVEEQYSDAIAGSTGGTGGHLQDRVVSHFTTSGQWLFRSARRTAAVGRGSAYIRRNDEPWDFEVSRGTRALMLHIPIEEVQLRPGWAAASAEQDSPASRLLLAHLRACIEIGDGIGVAARNATLELFRGLLAHQVIDDEPLYSAVARAAQECVDERLLSEKDLSPAVIAGQLHVSVRTLHRAFAAEGKSVMGYVRERRLARVNAELATTSWTISELAARWHFSSESHLIRSFRQRFGETPAGRRGRTRPVGLTRAGRAPSRPSELPASE
ncbi:helix-turn-helix domain-containing protein [Kineosporia mesophila]|uniref:Helix-turn-helix domain-containing protein n=1 Tax=Kineosporia mesophila TaxID=566012 RepID=A0ABP7ABG4_9ACTN|nr:AraC family transcriptional regulator [Kineosporia mesophila]MCD5351365.1 AraC family transcriptional regulator [Kineosporia mesophila]